MEKTFNVVENTMKLPGKALKDDDSHVVMDTYLRDERNQEVWQILEEEEKRRF